MALNGQSAPTATRTFPGGAVQLRRIDAWALRVAIVRPVETSFGIMRDRPAVFVRVEDTDGGFGFGEIWCNFPGVGAEHRVRMPSTNWPRCWPEKPSTNPPMPSP